MAKAAHSVAGFILLLIISAGLGGCTASSSFADKSLAAPSVSSWKPPFAYAMSIQSEPPALAQHIAPLLNPAYFSVTPTHIPQHLTLILKGTERHTLKSPALLGQLKPVERNPQLRISAELRDNLTNTTIAAFTETIDGPAQQRMAPSFKPIGEVDYNYTALSAQFQHTLITALGKEEITPKLTVLATTPDNQHVIVNLGKNSGLTIGQLFTTEDKSTQCVLVSFENSSTGANTRAVLRLRIGNLPTIGTPLTLISS